MRYKKIRVRVAVVVEVDREVTSSDVPEGRPMQGGQMMTEIISETIYTKGYENMNVAMAAARQFCGAFSARDDSLDHD